MKPGVVLFFLFGILCFASSASAASLYVSPVGTNNIAQNYPDWAGAANTISAAVAKAVGDDTILVTNALYTLAVQVDIGTNITVISTNGSGDGARAILDANYATRCFYLHHTGAVFRGFAVTRGSNSYGGGGYVAGGTVQDCIITNCRTPTTYSYGGGLYVNPGTVRDCTIFRNTCYGDGAGLWIQNGLAERCAIITNSAVRVAAYAYGGGVWANNSTIRDCVINGNAESLWGGGLYLKGSSGLSESCLVSNNSSLGAGGLYVLEGAVARNGTSCWNNALGPSAYGGGGLRLDAGTVSNFLICNNKFTTYDSGSANGGAGAWLVNGSALLANCRILGNTAHVTDVNKTGQGGGVLINAGTVSDCLISNNVTVAWWYRSKGNGVYMTGGTLLRCTVAKNYGGTLGGGIWVSGGTIRNCLIIGNSSQGTGYAVTPSGGGIYNEDASAGIVQNCTIVGNSATAVGGVRGGTMTNCIVVSNTVGNLLSVSGSYSCSPDLIAGTKGNITTLPLFVNGGSGYGTAHAIGNYHLTPPSPCFNAGTNQDWMTNAVDLDVLPRLRYSAVDMGAYELMLRGTIFSVR